MDGQHYHKEDKQHKVSIMYNVNDDVVPACIQDLIPSLDSEVSGYPLRHDRNITVPYNGTSFCTEILYSIINQTMEPSCKNFERFFPITNF